MSARVAKAVPTVDTFRLSDSGPYPGIRTDLSLP